MRYLNINYSTFKKLKNAKKVKKVKWDRPTDRPTDQPTDQPTDIGTYRAAIAAKNAKQH